MASLDQIQAQIATVLATVQGLAVLPEPADSIPSTPAAFFWPHRGTGQWPLVPNRRDWTHEWTVRIAFSRAPGTDRWVAQALPVLQQVEQAFRSHVTLGGTVTACALVEYALVHFDVGKVTYGGYDLVLRVLDQQVASYSG